MPNRTSDYNALPAKLKEVDAALREVCEVITGGTFNPDDIWGASAVEHVSTHVKDLAVDVGLKGKINDLLGGLPGGSAVGTAIQAMTQGLQGVVTKLEDINNEVGSQVSTRADAFKALMNPHSSSPAYNYQPVDGNYGFFPAITNAVTAGAVSGTDMNAIMGPLNDVLEVVDGAQGVATLIAFATGTIDLMGKALTPS